MAESFRYKPVIPFSSEHVAHPNGGRKFSHEHVLDIVSRVPGLQLFTESNGLDNTLTITHDASAVEVHIGGWFTYKLRDRSHDGPSTWQPTLLTQWDYGQQYDMPVCLPSVEESTYWLNPKTPIGTVFGPEQAEFIENPFEQLPFHEPSREALLAWYHTFSSVIDHQLLPLPGYYSLSNIPGIRRTILDVSERVLGQLGYQELTAVPTWWHTSQMYEHLGFHYQSLADHLQITRIKDALKKHLAKVTPPDYKGDHDARIFNSWLMVYQFWADLAEKNGFSPEELSQTDAFVLRDDTGKIMTYPLSPTHNLWMRKDLC